MNLKMKVLLLLILTLISLTLTVLTASIETVKTAEIGSVWLSSCTALIQPAGGEEIDNPVAPG